LYGILSGSKRETGWRWGDGLTNPMVFPAHPHDWRVVKGWAPWYSGLRLTVSDIDEAGQMTD
jgi:hypothetical protein